MSDMGVYSQLDPAQAVTAPHSAGTPARLAWHQRGVSTLSDRIDQLEYAAVRILRSAVPSEGYAARLS